MNEPNQAGSPLPVHETVSVSVNGAPAVTIPIVTGEELAGVSIVEQLLASLAITADFPTMLAKWRGLTERERTAIRDAYRFFRQNRN